MPPPKKRSRSRSPSKRPEGGRSPSRRRMRVVPRYVVQIPKLSFNLNKRFSYRKRKTLNINNLFLTRGLAIGRERL
jgi:hypothetical protein